MPDREVLSLNDRVSLLSIVCDLAVGRMITIDCVGTWCLCVTFRGLFGPRAAGRGQNDERQRGVCVCVCACMRACV